MTLPVLTMRKTVKESHADPASPAAVKAKIPVVFSKRSRVCPITMFSDTEYVASVSKQYEGEG